MRILVTGGAGFIGSHIVQAYVAAGHDVSVLDDLRTGYRHNIPHGVCLHEMSLHDPRVVDVLRAQRPEVINHHAAQIDVRKSVDDPAGDAHCNIVGSVHLFECARRAGTKKIIFASSGGAIYGHQDTFPADESHPAKPCNPYGIGKFTIELYLRYFAATYGLNTVALRYANVYGPRQNAKGEAGVIAIFANKLLRGETPTINGDGAQTRDYVFVDDVVQCNIAALRPDISGVFNVATGIETSVNELVRFLSACVPGCPPPRFGPAQVGEQLRSALTPGRLQKTRPIVLADGLQKTVEWFHAQ